MDSHKSGTSGRLENLPRTNVHRFRDPAAGRSANGQLDLAERSFVVMARISVLARRYEGRDAY